MMAWVQRTTLPLVKHDPKTECATTYQTCSIYVLSQCKSCRCTNKNKAGLCRLIHFELRTKMTQQIFSDLMPSLRLQHTVMTTPKSEKDPPTTPNTRRKMDRPGQRGEDPL